MVFKNQFIATIKVNDKIMRELKDDNGNYCVLIPFGTEFSIYLKNKDSRDALVKINIDGKDVLDNNEILIKGMTEFELKGYVKGNSVNNKFKFIEKTKEISGYGGDRIDDGIITIQYRFKKKVETIIKKEIIWPNLYYPNYHVTYWTSGDENVYGYYDSAIKKIKEISSELQNIYYNSEEGITVPGPEIKQEFASVYCYDFEIDYNTINIILRGEKIDKPLTVKDKLVCQTCGKRHKSDSKFCSECGTALIDM